MAAVAEDVSAVAELSVPVEVAFCAKLPSRALAVVSPACTWKALVLEGLKASCCLPVESVTTEAVILAFLKAAAALSRYPGLPMAAFIADARVVLSVTPPRFTETETLLPSAKPGPLKENAVYPAVPWEAVLAAFAKTV